MIEEGMTKAIDTFVPKAARKRFNASMPATVMGQAILFSVLLLIYIVVISLLLKYGKDFVLDTRSDLNASGLDWLFYVFLLFPLAVIILFIGLPAARQAWRLRKLEAQTIDTRKSKPGAFRLEPYSAADQDTYIRLDAADQRAFDFVHDSESSLLYLTGESGSGKSSLVSASLLPRLEEKGWRTLTIRIDTDPAARLRMALLQGEDLFPNTPGARSSLSGLLKRASEHRTKQGKSPLLIVIDQFEELLILNDPKTRAELLEVLKALNDDPLSGLRLLCVFRNDYEGKLAEAGLPDLDVMRNGFRLSSYFKDEAKTFMRASGRLLSDETYDELFQGLDKIEERSGLYRPITLNMAGLVISSMGGRVEGDPQMLIDRYLRRCLTGGDTRDYARLLLGGMITDNGTKRPVDVNTLAAETQIPESAVRATLSLLQGDGVVRSTMPDRSRWEISHDFIARQLGLLLGRVKRPFLRRTAPFVVPIAALLWGAGTYAAYDLWATDLQKRLRLRLSDAGFVVTELKDGLALRAGGPPSTLSNDTDVPENETLQDFRKRQMSTLIEVSASLDTDVVSMQISANDTNNIASLIELKNLKELTITLPYRNSYSDDRTPIVHRNKYSYKTDSYKSNKFTYQSYNSHNSINLAPLADLTELIYLKFIDSTGGTYLDIAPLAVMRKLETLDLSGTGVDNLGPLVGVTTIKNLFLSRTRVSDLSSLVGMNSLEDLQLNGTRVSNLAPLAAMTNLKTLGLNGTQVDDVAALTSMTHLHTLGLAGSKIHELSPLTQLTNLHSLYLQETGVKDLRPLMGMTDLKALSLNGTNVDDLSPLAKMTDLQYLSLSETAVKDLSPLASMTNLQYLSLGKTEVKDVTPLTNITGLQTLILEETAVENISPLTAMIDLQSLRLNKTKIKDLTPLAAMTSLQSLFLGETAIEDLSPLVAIVDLQSLSLYKTEVKDVTPLANMTGLQTLWLHETAVADLSPLASMTNLKYLSLNKTEVKDVTPLANMTGLQTLWLHETAVNDLSPLTAMTSLSILALNETAVKDLTPLGAMSGLQSLMLNGTAVKDLAPLESMTGLSTLWLNDTAVEDLTPIAGLTNLHSLSLNNTQIDDLGSLSNLPRLYDLHLTRTRIRSLEPLKNIFGIAMLFIGYSQVDDLSAVFDKPMAILDIRGLDIDPPDMPTTLIIQ